MKDFYISNTHFKEVIAKYFNMFDSIKSLSFLNYSENENRLSLRVRLLINYKFLLHSIGLNYCKNLYRKYKSKIELFKDDLRQNKITYEDIYNDIKPYKKDLFIKKIMAIEKWTKMYKFTNYTYQFEYFKIKPEYSFMDSTYQKASLIVVSKPNYNNERVVIYGIPSNLYKFEHITKNKYFYNMQHNVVNTVFLPISVKYKKISDKDLESYLKVDVTFWNKKPSTSYLAS